jgi:hypothetical protein
MAANTRDVFIRLRTSRPGMNELNYCWLFNNCNGVDFEFELTGKYEKNQSIRDFSKLEAF